MANIYSIYLTNSSKHTLFTQSAHQRLPIDIAYHTQFTRENDETGSGFQTHIILEGWNTSFQPSCSTKIKIISKKYNHYSYNVDAACSHYCLNAWKVLHKIPLSWYYCKTWLIKKNKQIKIISQHCQPNSFVWPNDSCQNMYFVRWRIWNYHCTEKKVTSNEQWL